MRTFSNINQTYTGLYEIWYYKTRDDARCGCTRYINTWSGRWIPKFWEENSASVFRL